ncbi:hypothetical protein AVEN_166801-2 [Araneus ventricosus]|uniref:CUB domain-containing protein n=1 Tax=Araneus ventricosus TaxID=182803 RepID=A0A4Y2BR60_ARAVE|nr:hypothetical protein AVEN_166801-2 [Araneus ventricosus]
MIIKSSQLLLPVVFLGIFGIQYAVAYRKYYVEDECTSPNKFQKVYFRLPSSGPDSVGELRPNRFGTYSRMGRNCLIKLVPPEGHGIIITVLRVDFRNHEGCKDYIKIFDQGEDEEAGDRLCGLQELGVKGKTYFSDGELRLLYHTSEGGMGFSNGFRLIFTVTKLDTEPNACTAPDQFKCDNTRCIWAGVTCDGINNCGDGSDETSAEHPHCRTYQQIYKNFLFRLADVTPVAITAVVLGITSFVAILVVMCICCCRSESDKAAKLPLVEDFPYRPNAPYTPLPGYSPLPGYTYGSMGPASSPLQPVHSPNVQASAPENICPSYSMPPGIPYVQQKVEIRYDRPPPYRA